MELDPTSLLFKEQYNYRATGRNVEDIKGHIILLNLSYLVKEVNIKNLLIEIK